MATINIDPNVVYTKAKAIVAAIGAAATSVAVAAGAFGFNWSNKVEAAVGGGGAIVTAIGSYLARNKVAIDTAELGIENVEKKIFGGKTPITFSAIDPDALSEAAAELATALQQHATALAAVQAESDADAAKDPVVTPMPNPTSPPHSVSDAINQGA